MMSEPPLLSNLESSDQSAEPAETVQQHDSDQSAETVPQQNEPVQQNDSITDIQLDDVKSDTRNQVRLTVQDEQQERECRICMDTSRTEMLIAPCNCKGSSQWIHRDCL